SYILGAGVIYLQNMVVLDEAIRTIKVEIQKTQNMARNSFVTGSADDVNIFTQRKINVGWTMYLQNDANGGIKIIRQAVYFVQSGATNEYDLADLRADIIKLKSGQIFVCDGGQAPKPTGRGGRLGTAVPLQCSQETDSSDGVKTGDEVDKIGRVVLDDTPQGLKKCATQDGKVGMFFTAGYGEPAGGAENCQIGIKNMGTAAINYRSLRINGNTGTVVTCGNYCTAGADMQPDPLLADKRRLSHTI
ncbi:MAG: hypothetical protein ACOCXT_04405, partial [Candidatus Dojkabacteria bacterium]